MQRVGKSHLITLVAGLVLGALALGVVSALTATTDVRVGLRHTEDGRVELAVQQRGDDGEWQAAQRPEARYLPPQAEVGKWHWSSPVAVQATAPEPEPAPQPDPTVMCIHGHAYPEDDRFWAWLLAVADVAGSVSGVDLRLYAGRDSAEHINDIRDCLTHDPAVIASSLPYPDELAPVLAEAAEAGATVTTFNSGNRDSSRLGSVVHVGVDDYAGGLRAGDQFDAQEVQGTALCVVHEANNIGLDERCEGLADGYDGGQVERLMIDPHGAPDPGAAQAAIATRIAEGGIGAILTLNSDTALIVLSELQARELEIPLGSFGFSEALAAAVEAGDVQFLVWDHPLIQGYLSVSAMMLAHILDYNQLDSRVFLNGARVLIDPTVADRTRVSELVPLFSGPTPEASGSE